MENKIISSATKADVKFVTYMVGKNAKHKQIEVGSRINTEIDGEDHCCNVLQIKSIAFNQNFTSLILVVHVRAKGQCE
jgi:hypothetical protein